MKINLTKTKLQQRINDLTNFLKENFPQITKEQRHLDKGSVEQYYWHYGYLMALKDIIDKEKVTENM